MSSAPRDREATAIATLVALCGPDGPDEWLPEHYDTAEAAAFVAAEWVRRDGRARAPEPQRVKRAPSKAQTRKPPELIASEAVVRARSGGDCEARTPWCEGKATQAHHKGGRTDHRPGSLLDVCGQGNVSGCHGYIHQHPDESYAAGWMTKRLGPVTPHVRDGEQEGTR